MTPWGERMKFFPKRAKTAGNAVKVSAVAGAGRGRGLFAPYSDWEADAGVSDYEKARKFTLSGLNALRGWRLVYSDTRLQRIETPHGVSVQFEYAPSGELLAVTSGDALRRARPRRRACLGPPGQRRCRGVPLRGRSDDGSPEDAGRASGREDRPGTRLA